MTNNPKALKDLLDKVESGGDIWPSDFPKGFVGMPRAIGAYEGSIDAALALIDKVLPEWRFNVGSEANSDGFVADISNSEWTVTRSGLSSTPSRALLIATLKALIYIEETKSDE
jgi:hypothetical protein